MQRRLRITLAVTAATGAVLLGAGTAAANPLSDLLGGGSSDDETSYTNHYGRDGADATDSDSSRSSTNDSRASGSRTSASKPHTSSASTRDSDSATSSETRSSGSGSTRSGSGSSSSGHHNDD